MLKLITQLSESIKRHTQDFLIQRTCKGVFTFITTNLTKIHHYNSRQEELYNIVCLMIFIQNGWEMVENRSRMFPGHSKTLLEHFCLLSKKRATHDDTF